MPEPPQPGPDVKLIPPLVYIAALLAGLVVSRFLPTHVVPRGLAHGVGAVVAAVGLCVAVAAVVWFRRAGTTVRPDRPSSALVTGGPFRFSRNPIYVGFALVHIGVALAAQSAWALLLLPAVLWVIRTQVIGPEEAFLRQRFGDAYAEYQARVPRWL